MLFRSASAFGRGGLDSTGYAPIPALPGWYGRGPVAELPEATLRTLLADPVHRSVVAGALTVLTREPAATLAALL